MRPRRARCAPYELLKQTQCVACRASDRRPSQSNYVLQAKTIKLDSIVWNLHFNKTTRSRRVHRCDDLHHMGLNESPTSLAEHYNRNLAGGQILLIPEVFVSRHQHFEPRGLSQV